MVKIFPVFHHFFAIINLSLTSKKERNLNSFFAKQCSLTDNGSTFPSLFPLITNKSLSDFDVLIEDIKNIIRKLGSNKTHGDNMTSICMFKLSDKPICKPLNICKRLQILSETRYFPIRREKSNVVPIHKKTTNSMLKTTGLFLLPHYS